jgi:uncharacterized protein
MKDTLTFLISSIVDKPDAVVINEDLEEGIINFIIHVDKDDIGKVIGKEGKVIRAIRNAMKIPAIKQNKRIHITVGEE